ncbi:MAG: DNA methyltransferase [Bacteroidia bacterium]|nr:DNA methyltransferase [Bacteroidia bacterium]
MLKLTDNSVHLIITSPPYWQLKDYGSLDQIGYNDSYENYINNLNLVWQECYRVLNPGCRLCVNIGDQFARAVYYGRYKVIPIREEIIKFCENAGFDYMGAIIWQKVTTSNTSGGGVQMGSYPYPRNGILKIDYEFILTFKKLGDAPKPSKEIKELSIMTAEEWNTFFASHWNFSGVKQDNHIAMFPEELPKRLIKMFSFVGDTVFDPFAGSGTTNLAAKKLQRNSVGYEINPDFIPLIKDKLNFSQTDLNGTTYEIINQEPLNEIEKEIHHLPYIFKDPHKFDKKVDPKKLQFGSKIDSNGSKKREELFTVKEIISPTKIRLSNDLIIKLLGIKEIPNLSERATDFLESKTKNKKVFIKFDSTKYDKNDNLLGYLYLENKTFVNAHLLRTGLVDVDKKIDFKYKDKFFTLIPHE